MATSTSRIINKNGNHSHKLPSILKNVSQFNNANDKNNMKGNMKMKMNMNMNFKGNSYA